MVCKRWFVELSNIVQLGEEVSKTFGLWIQYKLWYLLLRGFVDVVLCVCYSYIYLWCYCVELLLSFVGVVCYVELSSFISVVWCVKLPSFVGVVRMAVWNHDLLWRIIVRSVSVWDDLIVMSTLVTQWLCGANESACCCVLREKLHVYTDVIYSYEL